MNTQPKNYLTNSLTDRKNEKPNRLRSKRDRTHCKVQ